MTERLIIAPGGALEQSVEIGTDTRAGNTTAYRFIGSRTECIAQRIVEQSQGASQTRLRPVGDGNWELTSNYSFDAESGSVAAEPPTDTHELSASMAQQDVWTNPKLRAGLNASDRQSLKFWVDNYKRGKYESVLDVETLILTAGLSAPALAVQYFELICLEGVDHWIFYRSSYTRTITAATPSQVKASGVGAQKLWTTAQLTVQEGLPADWFFTLPSTTVWHKSEPEVTTNLGRTNKTQIKYTYIASNEASPLLYDSQP